MAQRNKHYAFPYFLPKHLAWSWYSQTISISELLQQNTNLIGYT